MLVVLVLVLVQMLVLVLVLLVHELLLSVSLFSCSHSPTALWFRGMRATHTAGTGMARSTRPRRAA